MLPIGNHLWNKLSSDLFWPDIVLGDAHWKGED